MELAKDILVIISLITVAALCLTIIAGMAVLLPAVRRFLLNMEKVTESAAEMAPHMAEAASNLKDTTAHVLSAAKDVSQATHLLRLLGPAGATANVAQQGIGRIGGFIRGLFRR